MLSRLTGGAGRVWTWIGSNHEQIKIFTAVLVAIYAAVNFHWAQRKEKKERALAYVEQYREGAIAASVATVESYWLQGEGREILERRKTLGTETPPVPVTEEIARSIEGRDIENAFYNLIGFYEEVALCAHEEICDADIICSHFFLQVIGFRNDMQAWISDLQGRIGADFGNSSRMVYCECPAELERYFSNIPGFSPSEVAVRLERIDREHCQ